MALDLLIVVGPERWLDGQVMANAVQAAGLKALVAVHGASSKAIEHADLCEVLSISAATNAARGKVELCSWQARCILAATGRLDYVLSKFVAFLPPRVSSHEGTSTRANNPAPTHQPESKPANQASAGCGIALKLPAWLLSACTSRHQQAPMKSICNNPLASTGHGPEGQSLSCIKEGDDLCNEPHASPLAGVSQDMSKLLKDANGQPMLGEPDCLWRGLVPVDIPSVLVIGAQAPPHTAGSNPAGQDTREPALSRLVSCLHCVWTTMYIAGHVQQASKSADLGSTGVDRWCPEISRGHEQHVRELQQHAVCMMRDLGASACQCSKTGKLQKQLSCGIVHDSMATASCQWLHSLMTQAGITEDMAAVLWKSVRAAPPCTSDFGLLPSQGEAARAAPALLEAAAAAAAAMLAPSQGINGSLPAKPHTCDSMLSFKTCTSTSVSKTLSSMRDGANRGMLRTSPSQKDASCDSAHRAPVKSLSKWLRRWDSSKESMSSSSCDNARSSTDSSVWELAQSKTALPSKKLQDLLQLAADCEHQTDAARMQQQLLMQRQRRASLQCPHSTLALPYGADQDTMPSLDGKGILAPRQGLNGHLVMRSSLPRPSLCSHVSEPRHRLAAAPTGLSHMLGMPAVHATLMLRKDDDCTAGSARHERVRMSIDCAARYDRKCMPQPTPKADACRRMSMDISGWAPKRIAATAFDAGHFVRPAHGSPAASKSRRMSIGQVDVAAAAQELLGRGTRGQNPSGIAAH